MRYEASLRASGWKCPTSVIQKTVYGLSNLKSEVQALGSTRALLLSGKTLARTEVVGKIATLLGDLCVVVHSDEPLKAVEAARSHGVDTLIGVGGSSIADALRVIAALLAKESDLKTGQETWTAKTRLLPWQVSIPTTLSAGEFTVGGARLENVVAFSPALYSDLIVLDAEMTMNTPEWLWRSTGIKALDHCIERLYAGGAIEGSLQAAGLLFKHLGNNSLESRAQCQRATWLATRHSLTTGEPRMRASYSLSHSLGHVLRAQFGIEHGYTSCLTQPHVMEAYRDISLAKQDAFAHAIGASDAVAAVQAVEGFIVELGMPHRLRDLSIPKNSFLSLANAVMEKPQAHVPVPTTVEKVLEILDRAW